MDSMTGPSLELSRATLSVIASAEPAEGAPLVDTWRRLVADLTEDEAIQLPAAIASVLDPLRLDPERFRLALDIITTFDLAETLPKLIGLGISNGDPDLALRAALLVSNPSVPVELMNQVEILGSHARFNERQRQSFAIRLNPSAQPMDDLQVQLQNQLWPGRWTVAPENVAPIVAVDELSGKATDRWTVLADLVEAGAVVKRLPAHWNHTPRSQWMNPRVPTIAWTDTSLARIRAFLPSFRIDSLYILDPASPRPNADRLISEVNTRLAGWRSIKARSVLPSRAAESPLSSGLYRQGAFDLKDMTFLSGCGAEQLRRLKDVLPARYPREREPYWSLNQVVAGRAYRYLQLAAPNKRISKQVITSLVEFAGFDEPTSVGINSGGEILVEHGGRFLNWKTREVMNPPDVLLDRVFQPFAVGRNVPDLILPSAYTRVHPDLAGGTPTVRGKRVPARAIAAIADQLRGGADLVESVRDLFPDLHPEAIRDAANLGRALLAAA
jgi:uncharacterized protein (DUF433 family)